ncbi:cupredoxin family copper-binding protein [Nocardia sp. NPDC049190]|uniref:cupredoxin domain-containing protein n=1 Tax=Nocardia sp. NPDC049190 TaxID=3155650 RepID=UPI0033EC84A1
MSIAHRRARPTWVVTGFAIGALLLSGCGADNSGTDATTTNKRPPPVATTSPPAGARNSAATVTVDDMKFTPAEVTVKIGDTVTWKFDDKVPHTVQGIGDKAMGINSPIFDRGQWSHTFTTPGTFRYLCSLHPEMRGSVTVE